MDDLLGPVVQPGGRGAHPADHLVGKPGCLSRDRVPQLRTRGDVAKSSLCLVACEHFVRELERVWARERNIDESLEFAACGEFGGDAFEHTMANERTRELLG
jgi:hypothetical protein